MASKKRSNVAITDDQEESATKKQRNEKKEEEESEANDCVQWKQPRSNQQIADTRASVWEVIKVMTNLGWKQLVSRVMATYDENMFGGKLSRLLDQRGIRLHVQVNDDDNQEEEKTSAQAQHFASTRFIVMCKP